MMAAPSPQENAMRFVNDPAGRRLPVKLDTTTNGEYEPIPLAPVHHEARHLAFTAADYNAKRLSLTRRGFLVSASGAASTLLAMNAAYAKAGKTGGFFEIEREAARDMQLARSTVDGSEFIFDVQGHFVNPTGAWLKRLPPGAKPFTWTTDAERCAPHRGPGDFDHLRCIGPDQFVKDVFMDSDTDLMVLSFVPSTREGEPLTIEEAAATARIVEQLNGTHRLLLHGRVNPNQPGDLDGMDELASKYRISAWKTYTQWGPANAGGFYMDDTPGIALIEKARRLGVRNIAIHKGLSFGPRSYEHSTCVDIGRVAKRYPDVNFLIYHSGFVADQREGPYDAQRKEGVDALVTSLLENGIRPGSNVYAELGSTWRLAMRDPTTAAHLIGKLVRYCGEDNVLWGTDSIWYGSPQDQIQAFRTFQIAPELRDRHGYAEITPTLRAKIFGLNALKIYPLDPEVVRKHVKQDKVARQREEYRERPDPAFVTYGPKTVAQLHRLLRWGG
jgi:predicted TIM-barrel fold metal-dependent hydrolase